MLALIAALFMLRAGTGMTPAGRAWLFALWMLPVPGRLVPGLEVGYYAAPVIAASLALCTLIALRETSRITEPA